VYINCILYVHELQGATEATNLSFCLQKSKGLVAFWAITKVKARTRVILHAVCQF